MSNYKTFDDDASLGKKAPSISSLKFIRGDKFELEEGKQYAILFWAKFDKGSSPQALDTFNALHKASPNIVFLGISTDPSADDAVRYFEKGGSVDFAIAFDEGKIVANSFKEASGLSTLIPPHGFLVDKKGHIVWREQFAQVYPADKSDFPKQVAHFSKGEPLHKNGNAPVKEVVEEVEESSFDGELF